MIFLPLLSWLGLASFAFTLRLSDRFAVSSTCGGHDVDGMLNDAVDLAKIAIAAIDTILQACVTGELHQRKR